VLEKPGGHLEDRPRREDDIKVVVKETGLESMQCIDMAQNRDNWRAVVNMVMKLRFQ
jgi:hypothetical protein